MESPSTVLRHKSTLLTDQIAVSFEHTAGQRCFELLALLSISKLKEGISHLPLGQTRQILVACAVAEFL